jgi:hypothetical protein
MTNRELLRKYNSHRDKAIERGISFEFSFEEWVDWWKTDDRLSRRGVGADKLVMARKGDVGPYRIDNVECKTNRENMQEIDRSRQSEKMTETWQRKRDEGYVHHLDSRGAKHPRSKPVITPQGVFGSAMLASEALGFSDTTIKRWVKSGKPGYAYCQEAVDAPIEKLTASVNLEADNGAISIRKPRAKSIWVNGTFYETATAAADANGIDKAAVSYRMKKRWPGWSWA